MREQIDELLNRKMDRRDFLKHLGVGTLALFGIGSAIKALTALTESQVSQKSAKKQAVAYGVGTYGGKPTN